MNASSWKPWSQAGCLVKTGKFVTMAQLLESHLPVKEPEIADFLLGNLNETMIKVINIGSGQYRKKAMVLVTGNNGWAGFGKSCAKNSKLAIAGAAKNARLNMFQIPVEEETAPPIVYEEYLGVEVVLGPDSAEMVASPMMKFILNLLGIKRGVAVSNIEKDTMLLIEALIAALKDLSNI